MHDFHARAIAAGFRLFHVEPIHKWGSHDVVTVFGYVDGERSVGCFCECGYMNQVGAFGDVPGLEQMLEGSAFEMLTAHCRSEHPGPAWFHFEGATA